MTEKNLKISKKATKINTIGGIQNINNTKKSSSYAYYMIPITFLLSSHSMKERQKINSVSLFLIGVAMVQRNITDY
jgi:hypothetical protein